MWNLISCQLRACLQHF